MEQMTCELSALFNDAVEIQFIVIIKQYPAAVHEVAQRNSTPYWFVVNQLSQVPSMYPRPVSITS